MRRPRRVAIDPRLTRAFQLHQLGRHDQAAATLGAYLLEEPDDANALRLLALTHLELEHGALATEHAQRAVEVEPDESRSWCVLGRVQATLHELDAAEASAREAVRVDPNDPDGFALLAMVLTQRKRWRDALAAADEGLRIDPEDDACTNLRGYALTQLGDRDGAAKTLQGQLARDPEDAATHANLGWTALHARDYATAERHFREALRLEPGMEWARDGVVETLKARHWFYRPVLRYVLWMSSLQAKWQVAILVGGWLGYRFAADVADGDSPYASLMWIPIVGYLVLVAATWFANPIATSLIGLHPLGRLAVPARERLAATGVCAMLVTGGVLIAAGWRDSSLPLFVGLALAFLSLPLKLAVELRPAKARVGMLAFTGVLACVAAAFLFVATATLELEAEIEPYLLEGRALVAEKEALADTDGPEAADLAVRFEDFHVRATAFDLAGRKERLDSLIGTGNVLVLVLAISAFWLSQFVAAGLVAWASKR